MKKKTIGLMIGSKAWIEAGGMEEYEKINTCELHGLIVFGFGSCTACVNVAHDIEEGKPKIRKLNIKECPCCGKSGIEI